MALPGCHAPHGGIGHLDGREEIDVQHMAAIAPC